MNQIINKFLLAGDKFVPEMHLKQPGFNYSACVPFTKHRERIQNSIPTGNLKDLYKNELDKACCAHDEAYADSKDLIKRTKSDKVLKYKAFEISNNPRHNGYERSLAAMVYKFFYKKSKGTGIKNKIKQNQQLTDELLKPVVRKF